MIAQRGSVHSDARNLRKDVLNTLLFSSFWKLLGLCWCGPWTIVVAYPEPPRDSCTVSLIHVSGYASATKCTCFPEAQMFLIMFSAICLYVCDTFWSVRMKNMASTTYTSLLDGTAFSSSSSSILCISLHLGVVVIVPSRWARDMGTGVSG